MTPCGQSGRSTCMPASLALALLFVACPALCVVTAHPGFVTLSQRFVGGVGLVYKAPGGFETHRYSKDCRWGVSGSPGSNTGSILAV